MIETIAIALWAHLFCGPWSESGKVFGWLKSFIYLGFRAGGGSSIKPLSEYLYNPLIGCAMCHAVWVAGIAQIWHVAHGCAFGWGNALQILGASFLAWLLDDFAELRDAWKNQ